VVLSALAQVGCKGFDEVLNNLKQEQRDCEQVHGGYMTVGAWKVFCTTLAFVLISRLLLHRSFGGEVSIVPLDKFWKYLHGLGGFCQLVWLLQFASCAGSAIYTICETLIADEKTSVIVLVGHLPNNLKHPFCETGIILFYFSFVFLLFFYETLRSAKVLRFVLQSSIIYFIIDLVVTQVAFFIFEEIQNVPSSQKWWMVTQTNEHTPEHVVIKPNITRDFKFKSFEL